MNGTPGVDDDGNGYIDDFWGWDWFNDDNSVLGPRRARRYGYLNDEHGTHCAGTIGAPRITTWALRGSTGTSRIMPLKFIGP
jgi:subtilisin family serine protease